MISPAFGDPAVSPIEPLSAPGLQSLLESQRGRVVLVNLWATWCSPCLKEIPVLMRLEKEYRDEGLKLVAVAMDDPGDLESVVRPFRDKWFPGWPTYQRGEFEMDRLVSVIDPAWNEILPTSYLIGRDGSRVATLFGGKSYEDFEAALLDAL